MFVFVFSVCGKEEEEEGMEDEEEEKEDITILCFGSWLSMSVLHSPLINPGHRRSLLFISSSLTNIYHPPLPQQQQTLSRRGYLYSGLGSSIAP